MKPELSTCGAVKICLVFTPLGKGAEREVLGWDGEGEGRAGGCWRNAGRKQGRDVVMSLNSDLCFSFDVETTTKVRDCCLRGGNEAVQLVGGESGLLMGF